MFIVYIVLVCTTHPLVTWVQTELKKMKETDVFKKLKISDAAKVVAQKWRLLSDEEKIKWKREKEAERALAGEHNIDLQIRYSMYPPLTLTRPP